MLPSLLALPREKPQYGCLLGQIKVERAGVGGAVKVCWSRAQLNSPEKPFIPGPGQGSSTRSGL